MSTQAFFMPKFTNDTTTSDWAIREPGAFNTPGTVTQSFPLGGTIKRILIGSNGDIGDGSVSILRFPNGVLPSVALPSVPFTGAIGTATTKITYDQDFQAEDGLVIQIVRNTDISNRTLTVTLELEFVNP